VDRKPLAGYVSYARLGIAGRRWILKRFSHGGNTGSNPVGDANKINGLGDKAETSVPFVSRLAHFRLALHQPKIGSVQPHGLAMPGALVGPCPLA
jgi:hypothetical protein